MSSTYDFANLEASNDMASDGWGSGGTGPGGWDGGGGGFDPGPDGGSAQDPYYIPPIDSSIMGAPSDNPDDSASAGTSSGDVGSSSGDTGGGFVVPGYNFDPGILTQPEGTLVPSTIDDAVLQGFISSGGLDSTSNNGAGAAMEFTDSFTGTGKYSGGFDAPADDPKGQPQPKGASSSGSGSSPSAPKAPTSPATPPKPTTPTGGLNLGAKLLALEQAVMNQAKSIKQMFATPNSTTKIATTGGSVFTSQPFLIIAGIASILGVVLILIPRREQNA